MSGGLGSGAIAIPEYLSMNPMVWCRPVKDGDLIMWESNAICRYLATTYNGEHIYQSANPAASRSCPSLDGFGSLASLCAPMGQLRSDSSAARPRPRPWAIETARRRARFAWTIVEDD